METDCFKNTNRDAQGLASKHGVDFPARPLYYSVNAADRSSIRTDLRQASGLKWVSQQDMAIEPHLTGEGDDSCLKHSTRVQHVG